MVQIVSGLSPKARMDAYLAGGDQQLKIHALKMQQEEQRARHQDVMARAAAEYKQEQAKALADTNARAQMGDAMAMEQQNMEARAANKPPELKRLEEMSGILGKISDPKAREFATEEFKNYEKGLRDEQEKQAALGIIKQSSEDGHMDQAQAEARIQAGEDPKIIAREAQEIAQERAAGNMAMEDSALAIEQAEALLQAANKKSKGAKLAKNTLELFKDSPSSQRKPGKAAEMLKAMKDALVRGEATAKLPSDTETKRRLSGHVIGQVGPANLKEFREGMEDKRPDDTFSRGGYEPFAKKIAAEKERRYPGGKTLKTGKPKPQDVSNLAIQFVEGGVTDELELMTKLAEQGLVLDDENIAIITETLKARRNYAAEESGADQP